MAKTLYEKIWSSHFISELGGDNSLIYIDRHLVHEVTSPQAFAGLRAKNRPVKRLDKTFATMDHNISTQVRSFSAAGETSRKQLEALAKNCVEFSVTLFDLDHENQGIVHVIGPELGITLPGHTIVCGDSHTATHGAFGALAFGIGTSEVEHVLATQTLQQKKAKSLKIEVNGSLRKGITAKDIVLAIIQELGVAGGTGYVAEFCGQTIEELSMEGRMTLCNMAIEFGAKAGLVTPDQKTFDYVKGKEYAPKGQDFVEAVKYWKTLATDQDAQFDHTVSLHSDNIKPKVTWGTSPEHVVSIDSAVPNPEKEPDEIKANAIRRAIEYMGLEPEQNIVDIKIDTVFIGSCTNSRIEDMREAVSVIKGRKIVDGVRALVVPGSLRVKKQAEREGLDKIFINSGFEWREPGCSMCLAMNDDRLRPGDRCASTSNRNFEGRQGKGGRTHLVSPAMAAAAAIYGHFVDVSNL